MELTIISVLATFIGISVALIVAFNFYSIYDFQKRQKKLESDFEDKISSMETSFNSKMREVEKEFVLCKEVNHVYVKIMYEVHNANAKFCYNDKHYFEAIVHELRNIYHVTEHKSSFSEYEFAQIIGVKYWFIAQDVQKYGEDEYLCSDDEGKRNKVLTQRDEIISLCTRIETHVNAIDVEMKLLPIRRVIPTLIDDMYYHKPITPTGKDWDRIREMAK